MKIIFAQGNPGPDYSTTRHNTGFMAIDALAEKYAVNWQKNNRFNAHIAEVLLPNEKILLVKPDTFYNNSGESARALLDFYRLKASEDILVIHDELMLPLGTVRVRTSGRHAGNNGIKSLNLHIGENFHRIRVGIENELRPAIDADEFVLGKFRADELDFLKNKVIPHILAVIEDFVNGNRLHGNLHIEK